MVGTVKHAKLETRKARRRLKAGRQPHWQSLRAGRDHLGWQRWDGDAAGRWLLRRRRGGNYSIEVICIADDVVEANGILVFDYEQAKDRAVELSADDKRPAGRITVKQAMIHYIDYLKKTGKDTKTAVSTARRHINPTLGPLEVASLTSTQIQAWVAGVAQMGNDNPFDDETVRRRRQASANRHLSVLKAALNRAFKDGHVSSNLAWGLGVEKFKGVDSTDRRSLTVDEAKLLLAAADSTFYPLLRAALETGCRYAEIGNLTIRDFDKASGTVHVRKSKSKTDRHVRLTAAGVKFFSDACAGRSASDLMFVKADGKRWGHGNARFYLGNAIAKAGIEPIKFHELRHTWASLSIRGGVPLMVVAKNLGHSDIRMLEKRYAHLFPDHISEAIKKGAPRFV